MRSPYELYAITMYQGRRLRLHTEPTLYVKADSRSSGVWVPAWQLRPAAYEDPVGIKALHILLNCFVQNI